jgi:hypothetical protein
MMRDNLASEAYWNKWVAYVTKQITDMIEECKIPAKDTNYYPQYVFELTKNYWELMLYRYSRGDPIQELVQYFAPMLDAWEESKRLGKDVWTPEQQYTRNTWTVNLDLYIVSFWLVGLALTLEISEDLWQRLLVLIGNEGNDILLDRIIATRSPQRKIGDKLCHPKPYQRLLKAIDAPVNQQPQLLSAFVDNWYAELNRPNANEMAAVYARPYWYNFGNRNLEGGAYFGRWCVEAVAAVKALGLDDSLCLGHRHYPGDLLRPNGPSTHGAQEKTSLSPEPIASHASKRSWWQKWFG